ncbi:MAG: GTPase Era, partial [Pseudomonadota bacterium]
DADGTRILERLDGTARPVVLILNKIDLIERSSLLALIAELAAKREFAATMLISALSGDGITDLRAYLADKMPSGPWLFPEDDLSDLPMRMLAAEITREKLFLRLHQELPYASTVETTEWKTLRDGSARIEQTIYVERPSQKQIVLGKSGRTIKAISSEARAELRDAIGSDVHLFLFVKVRENWGNDPERFREMGLEFPKL